MTEIRLKDSLPPSPAIPKDLLEEITGCQVLSYLIEDGSKPGDGFMSVVYSVSAELVLSTEEGEPVKEMRHFLFKCFPRHPARQSYLCKTNMFYSELSFYRVWVKALSDLQVDNIGLTESEVIAVPFPPFVGGSAINFSEQFENEGEREAKVYKPLDNFIVMTDLKKSQGFQMVDKAAGLDLHHLKLAFTELAKIHALSWAFKNKVEWNVLKKYPFMKAKLDEDDKDFWSNIVGSNVEIAAKAMDGALGDGNVLSKSTRDFGGKVRSIVEFFIEQNKKMDQEIWRMHRSPPPEMVEASKSEKLWSIQCHGDAWSNNMLFKYNQATGKPDHCILFDFQLTRESCPTVDLSYLIYTSTTTKFQKAHMDALLQLYCTKFTDFCAHLKVAPLPGFGLDSLKRRFQRAKLIGFMMAITAFPNMFGGNGNETNLEMVREDMGGEEMFIEAFKKGALESEVYRDRIIDVAQDLYDDGVI